MLIEILARHFGDAPRSSAARRCSRFSTTAGYTNVRVPPGAFDNDPPWHEAVKIVERLRAHVSSAAKASPAASSTSPTRTTGYCDRRTRSSGTTGSGVAGSMDEEVRSRRTM